MKSHKLFAITLMFGILGNFSPAFADYWCTVYTPRGSTVKDTMCMTYELTAAEIAANNQYVANNYPNATRETNSSRKYNCHSYAWYSQSTSNSVWIGYSTSTAEDIYWGDASYIYKTYSSGNQSPPSSVPVGAKANYPSGNHSGIKASSTKIRSKWGKYPRMLHTPGYSPYVDTRINYYILGLPG